MSTTSEPVEFSGQKVGIYTDNDVDEVVRRIAAERSGQEKQRAFVVGDLTEIIRRHETWTKLLPRVRPFYAVKTNSEPPVLNLLASLGAGFDCATKGELQRVLDQVDGGTPSGIIFANTCKQPSDIRYAARRRVELLTFDSEFELHKIKENHPNAKLVLRIIPPVESLKIPGLRSKYGCHLEEVEPLLQLAKSMKMTVVGVSFHVRTCFEASLYAKAIDATREAFDRAKRQGFDLCLLDIGGGFDGRICPALAFEETAAVVTQKLNEQFPSELGVSIVGEPGQFLVMSAFTLCSNIISLRVESDADHDEDAIRSMIYYIDEGTHGLLSFLHHHNCCPDIQPLHRNRFAGSPRYKSVVWGPTQDSIDCVKEECLLPRLGGGDWVVFKDMGAYSFTDASNFHLMPRPKVFYVVDDRYRHKIPDKQ